MNKIKFSLVSFLATLLVASTAYATECTVDADCAAGEVCAAVASAECPPCAEGSACDTCATEILACVPGTPVVDCGTASSGSGSGAEGSAAVDPDCGSGNPSGSGSGSGEPTPVAGSGSGTDVEGSGSGATATAEKSKSDSGCSTVPATAGILGFFAMIGTLLFLRRRNSVTK